MTRTWLFGEAEYESTESFEENFKRLWDCGEACGYMVEVEKKDDEFKTIVIDGSDLEHVRIKFQGDKVIRIIKRQYTDRTGEIKLYSREEIVVN
ncbi:MAG: hypothetical protein QQN41_11450 [Nitrosopumilus sp.]